MVRDRHGGQSEPVKKIRRKEHRDENVDPVVGDTGGNSVRGAALAQPKSKVSGAKSTVRVKSSKVDLSGIPTKGLTAALGVMNGKIGPAATAAGEAKWLDGTSSNTYYWNPFFNRFLENFNTNTSVELTRDNWSLPTRRP
jgi:hypothetical protein